MPDIFVDGMRTNLQCVRCHFGNHAACINMWTQQVVGYNTPITSLCSCCGDEDN